MSEGIGKVTGDELNWKGWEAVFVGNHSDMKYKMLSAKMKLEENSSVSMNKSRRAGSA